MWNYHWRPKQPELLGSLKTPPIHRLAGNDDSSKRLLSSCGWSSSGEESSPDGVLLERDTPSNVLRQPNPDQGHQRQRFKKEIYGILNDIEAFIFLFVDLYFFYLSRAENGQADALAKYILRNSNHVMGQPMG